MNKIKILKDVDFQKMYAASKEQQRLKDESSDYSTFEFSHGYGSLCSAGVVVSKGVSATVHVDIKISTYAEASYKKTVNEIKNVLDSQITEQLDECSSQKNYSNWWLWLFSANRSDYEHHKNSKTETVNTTDTTVSDSLKQNFSKNKQDYHVTGDFTVVGTSFEPTKAFLFVEMLKIKTKDGNTTTVINSSPTAADEEGYTDKASVQPGQKLNIEPLS